MVPVNDNYNWTEPCLCICLPAAEGQVEEAIRRGFLATDEDMLNG